MNDTDLLTNETKIAALFDIFRQPARFRILMVIREQPACVCHLETALGLRQASISQHLMILRREGWVSTRRESRNIFYQIAEPRLIDLIQQAAVIQGVSMAELDHLSQRPLPDCPCPQCNPNLPPEYSCKDQRIKRLNG